MEESTPQFLLLQESEKRIHFSFKTTTDEVSDWLTVETKPRFRSGSAEQQDKKGINGREQSSSSFGNVNKGLRSPYRRLSLGAKWSRRERLNLKFEHFPFSSLYIEQYRNAKQFRLEEALNKLLEQEKRTAKSSTGCRGMNSLAGKEGKLKGETSNTGSSCLDFGQQERHSRLLVNTVKPSLPQSGYFSGKKWVYPKDIDLCDSISYHASRRGSSYKTKKPALQVFNARNMVLQGQGKPVSTSCNKTWTASRPRTVCKSAPVNSQRYHKVACSPSFSSVSPSRNTSTTPPSQSETKNFSSMVEGHKLTKLVPKTYHSFEKLKKDEKVVQCSKQTNRQQSLEYENMFKDVISFYEHCTLDPRSQVYIRIGM